ncbi:isocitrate/isopropylmalate family dehydrogenase [Pseudenhygromyxa sp. WMMC2535]|uniref:isocitrate/isopropylmalate family dehydrogenase n=1 Tax=Pseudenhygromyxa sp. WMMC2535 TaxID=2712867 RepID=UPI0020D1AC49|nr:isocitrate/isopropylmalate family dehydrogenase [Pseudenhygromyxa sp. WMMC2535]
MSRYTIVELHGDGIARELSQSVHTVAEALPFELDFVPVDLSDQNREARGDVIYDETEAAMRRHGTSMKYPTATTRESPNRVIRERCNFAVIHRPVHTIPGIQTNFSKTIDLDIIRIATGGTYEDAGRRINRDTAVSIRTIERRPSVLAARFAFRLAQLRGTNVIATSKYTIQQATDGLFQEAARLVAQDYPATEFREELFDALLAGVIMRPERYGVIVCPNEYGDFLSDMAYGLIGSIGLGDSASYGFNESGEVSVAMFDPAGGTAPDIAGQNKANPTAVLMAMANMLRHIGEVPASKALRGAVLASIEAGEKTADIGGQLSLSAFTEVVIGRMKDALG